ncbi:MAG: hypothetical protein LBL90_02990 [Prevotellaceae bacterium]|jgi:hypothetical protein|nr:hypothetical protein [Prevotellaceae bacterium]
MRLEDFIKNNVDEFNNKEPSTGHFERFEQRLKENQNQNRKPSNLRWLISVAAVMVGLMIGLTLFVKERKNPTKGCIMSGEMLETQNYYVSILNDEVKRVEMLLGDVVPEIRDEVMGDVKQIVADSESFTRNFCNNSETGTAVIVEYYHAKIQAVQNITTIFETNKQ